MIHLAHAVYHNLRMRSTVWWARRPTGTPWTRPNWPAPARRTTNRTGSSRSYKSKCAYNKCFVYLSVHLYISFPSLSVRVSILFPLIVILWSLYNMYIFTFSPTLYELQKKPTINSFYSLFKFLIFFNSEYFRAQDLMKK